MLPLQSGIPGGPELLLLVLVVLLIVIILPFVLAYWVYSDATDRGMENAVWWTLFVFIVTLGTAIGGFLAVWVYTLKRDEHESNV